MPYVIDAVNREDARVPASRSDAHTVVEVMSGADIAAILRANRGGMVRNSVVSSGAKPEKAQAQFDANIALLEKVAGARLNISASQADLELRLK